MEPVTQYKAIDGTLFSLMSDALKRDCLVVAVEIAMRPLVPCNLNDREWIQHDDEACLQAKRNMLALVREQYSTARYPVLLNSDDVIHPMSAVGRIVSEGGGPLSIAWGRLGCINWDNFREYSQPYFALHPEQANEDAVA